MRRTPDPPGIPEDWLTGSEVATMLRIHPKTVEQWARLGLLPSFKVAGRRNLRRFSRSAVADWQARQKKEGA